jgi:hypothetical protein
MMYGAFASLAAAIAAAPTLARFNKSRRLIEPLMLILPAQPPGAATN